jgi:hypothetical protein
MSSREHSLPLASRAISRADFSMRYQGSLNFRFSLLQKSFSRGVALLHCLPQFLGTPAKLGELLDQPVHVERVSGLREPG